MASASRALVVVVLSLLCLCRAVFSSEYFSTLTLFNNELHKQGCSSLSEWEEYAADCGKVSLFAVTLPRPPPSNCHRAARLALPLRANDERLITSRSGGTEEAVKTSCCLAATQARQGLKQNIKAVLTSDEGN